MTCNSSSAHIERPFRKPHVIALLFLAGLSLIVGCGAPPPHVPGCITACRYTEYCTGGEGCYVPSTHSFAYAEKTCTSDSECEGIADNTEKIGTNPRYKIDWEDGKCGSEVRGQSFPASLKESCAPYDGRMCSSVGVPAACVCDRSKDADCDQVLDAMDQCLETADPLLSEDKWFDEFMNDGCADIDNDEDGICDSWVVQRGLQSTFFTSRGCVGGIGECCAKDGEDRCPDRPCKDEGTSLRCSDMSHKNYGCATDYSLVEASKFSASVVTAYGTAGTPNEDIADFLSFESSVDRFPKYNEVTITMKANGDFPFAKELRVKWNFKPGADPLPTMTPASGETGFDEPFKLVFTHKATTDRGHPLSYEIQPEISNLGDYVTGSYVLKPVILKQSGADQCVQRGLDIGPIVEYGACRYEAAELKAITFTSDHQLTSGDNILRRGGANFWDVGPPYNTKADPSEFLFDGSRNNPISHTAGSKLEVKVVLNGIPKGTTFSLEGVGQHQYGTFAKITKVLDVPEVAMTASAALPFELGVLQESITWTLKLLDSKGAELASKEETSGPHKIYATYFKPIEGTSLTKDVTLNPPWSHLPGTLKAAGNRITDKKLEMLLRPYSETNDAWGIAGGLTEIEAVVDVVHKFMNSAEIITKPRNLSCFAATGTQDYLWAIFDSRFGSQCVERALLMEMFLKTVGLDAKGLQVKAADALPVPTQNMINEPPVVYKSRPQPVPDEWLLMNFSDSDTDPEINEGEGVTEVDLSQGVGTTRQIRFYPHALRFSNDAERRSRIANSHCDVLTKVQASLGINFQQWCKKFVPPNWECSDRVPAPACPE